MKNIKKIISIVIIVLLLPILFVNVVILVDSVIHPNEIPGFFGYKPFIVLSNSMKGQINSGDLVITKEIDPNDLKEGDIISFKEKEFVVTHRIVKIKYEGNEKHFITKGDNNGNNDIGYVLPENVQGIYITRISGLGNVANFIQTPIGILVSLSIPLAILFCMLLKPNSYTIEVVDENKKK